jgi:hypothetical protein
MTLDEPVLGVVNYVFAVMSETVLSGPKCWFAWVL